MASKKKTNKNSNSKKKTAKKTVKKSKTSKKSSPNVKTSVQSGVVVVEGVQLESTNKGTKASKVNFTLKDGVLSGSVAEEN